MTQSEEQLEVLLVRRLERLGFSSVTLDDAYGIERNLRTQLAKKGLRYFFP